MRLKKLEIQGFKSFADRTEMTFEDGITGVVGPNGSGKSNISDAVRWVLGEQSAKTLRGAKMEDVIFGGTEKRRRLSFCEVSLVFDNEDRALPIDYSEVCVTRRVYRSGEGEYSINRTPCRLRDVVDLFRDTGIGKEGYSLIGQGRIDEILSAKSEDRRNIFEEAAGIVKYKARKTEAERRLENTRLNLSRVEDILRELEDRVEPLRRQSEVAREYIQLRDELKGLELNVFLARSERYAARLAELTEVLAGLTNAVDDCEKRQTELTAERDGAQEALARLEEKTAAAREVVLGRIQEAEAREGAVSVLRERIASSEKEGKRLESQLAAAKQGEGGVDAETARLGEKIASESAALADAQSALTEQKARLGETEAALSRAEEGLEKTKADLIAAMNRLGDVRSEQARLRAMRDALASRMEAVKTDRSEGDSDREDSEKQLNEARRRLSLELAEKQRLDEASRDADERVRALGEKSDRLSNGIRALTARRQEISSRLRVLEELQRDYDGYQNSVKNVLLQAKRLGGAGVKGVVATLIRVPKEYERAVDMVLGAALQNVVVEREEDAKRMIDYLRLNRMGRATFLPISAVRGRTLDNFERRVLAMEGCAGLATELIGFDEEYRGVVESLLGRTVIARDLESGIEIMRMGRHAFRLVTLEGDVMHSGGSMTGGSVQSRMSSLLSREREVAEHQKALKETEGQLAQAETQYRKVEEARALRKKERAELFEKLHQQEIACAREEAHLSAFEAELDERSRRSAQTREEGAQIEAQLRYVDASLEAVSSAQGSEEQSHGALREDIARRQDAVSALRRDGQSLRQRTQEESVRIAAAARGLDAMIADRERLLAQKKDMARLLSESERLLAENKASLDADAAKLNGENAALNDAKHALDAARAAFTEADDSRTASQTRIRETGKALDALRAEADDFSERRHRAEMQKARAEDESAQMTKRIWEDYELTYEGALPFRDEAFRLTDSEKRIAQIRQRIKAMGSVNVSALDEFREVSARVEEISGQRDDLVKAELDLQGIIEELLRKMDAQFRTQFDMLNRYFQKTFVKLFGGGQAELKLADPKDALNCGIEVVAQPPGKKLQLLSLLSGGERALTAISILFAMLELKPTPFCFLDEIEAALDDANIDNFADYLRDYSRNTQFVVVTHRKGTMERCDALYGVAMEEKGVSRMMSVQMRDV